ncbi:MAG: amidophosphoribosyltransferase [Bacteriovoracaceae bacterium]|nr:amidophosphoribosyltransferase [Bacteriovoracaceae bacterium]
MSPSGQSPSRKNQAIDVYRGLLTLQHRGQDAAGILSYDSLTKTFHSQKELGLVANVFNTENLGPLKGNMAIGHTRYATAGGNQRDNLQPLVTGYPFGIGMVHNGNLINYHSVRRKLKSEENLQMLTTNDLEIFLHLWCKYMTGDKNKKDFSFHKAVRASEKIFNEVEGGFALLGLIADVGLIALRDPHGIRPLVLGIKENTDNLGQKEYCVSSETVTLHFLGFEYVRDIAPGELIHINNDGELLSHIIEFKEKKNPAPCMFEWVYFSGAESSIHKKSVYEARLNLGKLLANKARKLIEKGDIQSDVVCPVPDTSRTASISLAENLGLPYREALIKNRYVHRSFILNTQEKRENAVELKLSPVISEIKEKRILLVDDSIVRGTTSKKIISLLKKYGAKEITLAITCPPLRYACYYGIDFPNPEELIAKDKTLDQIADWVGANQVIYLDESDLVDAIGEDNLCMACINNKYPTSIKDAEEFMQMRQLDKETTL